MSLGEDTAAIFDSHINAYLQQYAVTELLHEAYYDDEEEEGIEAETEDIDVQKVREIEQQTEKEKETYNSRYPEPLKPDVVAKLFHEIENCESQMSRFFGNIKVSAKAVIDVLKDLISGKLPIGSVWSQRHPAGYRRQSSPEDYIRYVSLMLPELESIYEKINQQYAATPNIEEIEKLKTEFADITVRAKLKRSIIETITKTTQAFLSDLKTNTRIEGWVAEDKVQIAKERLNVIYKKYEDNIKTVKLHNMRAVCKTAIDIKNALDYLGYSNRSLVEDLVGEGVKGLDDAVNAFDVSRGNTFLTAAQGHIIRYMREFLYRNSTVQIPIRELKERAAVKKAKVRLTDEKQRKVEYSEIVNHMRANSKLYGFTPDIDRVVEILTTSTSPISMSTPADEFGEEDLGSKMKDTSIHDPGTTESYINPFKDKIEAIRSKLPPKEREAAERLFNFDSLDPDKFTDQILTVRRQLQRMKLNNESFDSEINKYLELYLEVITPVNGITNVGKQQLTIDPSKMTGEPDCAVSAAAYEMYNMSEGNKTPKKWQALNDDERKNYVNLIQAKAKLSDKVATNPAVTKPAASPNQQTMPSSKVNTIGPIGAI